MQYKRVERTRGLSTEWCLSGLALPPRVERKACLAPVALIMDVIVTFKNVILYDKTR